MRFSRYFIPTLKETPADADTASARLMLRAGMIRKVAAGLYDWLPMGHKVLKKVENIVREEMNRAGALEVWLPVIQPKELWEETGRWQFYGRELLRIKDRKNNEFCFAPTAEEMITDLVRKNVKSSRELPLNLYQFGTKFRDEIRPRFGIMRSREFLMKDAYSFHSSEADLDAEYNKMSETYSRIFTRLGLKFRPVEADSGAIGGNSSQEFMVLAETGEDLIASCPKCGYAANLERAEVSPPAANGKEPPLKLEEVSTPNATKVVDVVKAMGTTADRVIKTVFMVADGQTVVALVRGDTDLNVPKFQKALGAKGLRPANEAEYAAAAGGSDVGFAGPQNITVRMVADHLVAAMSNAIVGGGKKDVHLRNANLGRDFKIETVADIRNIREGEPCPKCQTPVEFFRGIEVGHVFKLGTKYSASMKCEYLAEDGTPKPMIMGCYGIGVSRIVAAAIEQNNDEWGIRWPAPIAPFTVIVTPANVTHDESRKTAEMIYAGLIEKGVDVLLDDRDVRAGFKFKDADLIGIPFRVTIGEKSLARGMVELKLRTDAQAVEVPVDKAIEKVMETLKAMA
jgi:prolyl-tRNA synthetase